MTALVRFLHSAMGIPAERLLVIDEAADLARETFYAALRNIHRRDRVFVLPRGAALTFLSPPTWAHRETDPGAM